MNDVRVEGGWVLVGGERLTPSEASGLSDRLAVAAGEAQAFRVMEAGSPRRVSTPSRLLEVLLYGEGTELEEVRVVCGWCRASMLAVRPVGTVASKASCPVCGNGISIPGVVPHDEKRAEVEIAGHKWDGRVCSVCKLVRCVGADEVPCGGG